MFEFLRQNPTVGFAPVSFVNDPAVVASGNRFVSVNSARKADLHGQIVTDTIGPPQYSGAGGHEGFLAEASLSLEHTSLICRPAAATVDGETKSRVTRSLASPSAVATPRHLTGVDVTESGCADLRGLATKERAHALALIAHPQCRDELVDAAESLGL